METLYRYDEEERVLHMCTTNPKKAEEWGRFGYAVRPLGYYPGGKKPGSWEATGPIEALRLRRVRDGQVIKRPPPPHAFGRSDRLRPQEDPGDIIGARDDSRENAADSTGEGPGMGSPAADAPSPSPLVEGREEELDSERPNKT